MIWEQGRAEFQMVLSAKEVGPQLRLFFQGMLGVALPLPSNETLHSLHSHCLLPLSTLLYSVPGAHFNVFLQLTNFICDCSSPIL